MLIDILQVKCSWEPSCCRGLWCSFQTVYIGSTQGEFGLGK